IIPNIMITVGMLSQATCTLPKTMQCKQNLLTNNAMQTNSRNAVALVGFQKGIQQAGTNQRQ
ncbi:MAG: hypothetical protein ACKPKO_11420, partial [Candidatus Fonsibacter sp.]